MSEVRKYSHNIFHRPGDEGSESSENGKTYPGADCANEAAPLGGPHDHVHLPGVEGVELGTGAAADKFADNVQGYQNVPPGDEMGLQFSGPEVRRTYVAPASDANPYEGMPGAK